MYQRSYIDDLLENNSSLNLIPKVALFLSSHWKIWVTVGKSNHMSLISHLVFQLNVPPFNSKLPGLYHLRYTWNSSDILPFEIEGTHSATNKTLVWQARGHEIKSRRRQKEMWCGRRKAIRWESIWKRRLCCRRQAINVHTSA